MTRLIRQIITTLAIALLFVFVPRTDGLAVGWDVSVDVWLDKGDGGVYQPGESVTVYFKADADCFVTVYNIDTEGNIRILFPVSAEEGNYVAGGETYYVPAGIDDHYYIIDEPAGMGYIEAVASPKPFFLEGWPFFVSREGGGYHDGDVEQIAGDPFLAMEEINNKILPFGEDTEYNDDFAVYYVEEMVSYPRYVCNDCHRPVYYHYDPYYYPCHYVDIVIYDYWWYNRWFYCDYWWADYYWYYDYYYYSPPPPYLGRRYTRKYGYTKKYPNGHGYTTKGYGDKGSVVRVSDYYRQKDDYRDDFSPLDPKNNAVLSYKPPQPVNETGYVPGGGVTKKGPAADGRAGDGSVTTKSPAGTAGSDFRAGEKGVRTKSPVRDGTAGNDVSQGARTEPRVSKPERAPDGEETSRVTPRTTRKAPAVEREAPKIVKPPRYEDRGRSPAEDDRYKRPSEEYKLQGWDRSRSSDAKESSSLSIIKSKPRSSDSDRSSPRAKTRVAPSRPSTSTRSAPERSIAPRSSGTRSTPKINRSAPSSRGRSTPSINKSSSQGRSTPKINRRSSSRGRSSAGARRR